MARWSGDARAWSRLVGAALILGGCAPAPFAVTCAFCGHTPAGAVSAEAPAQPVATRIRMALRQKQPAGAYTVDEVVASRDESDLVYFRAHRPAADGQAAAPLTLVGAFNTRTGGLTVSDAV